MKKLLTAALTAAALVLPAAVSYAAPSAKAASAQPAKAKGVWIDVRSEEEFKSGHLQGAVNIPHDQIGQQIAAHVPNKNTPINLYCRSGRRAEAAKQVLESMGYTNVQNRGSYVQLTRANIR